MKSPDYRKIAIAAIFAFGSFAFGQPPAPTYHPDETLRLTVAFEGPDADKIQNAAFAIELPQRPADQFGFATSLYAQESKKTAPNTFEITVKIPKNQASGTYKLVLIRVSADPGVQADYSSPSFKERSYLIDNPRRFVKPTIESVTEP